MSQYSLLSVGRDAKTVKGEKFGYLTGIVYLQPASLSGVNLCPGSSAGCRAACLFTSGAAAHYPKVNQGRARKTQWFLKDREGFMRALMVDISKLERAAARKGMKPVVRINGTSDIQIENIQIDGKTIFEHFPQVAFMDYTKIAKRMFAGSKAQSFPNYHLTFSRSESNHAVAETVAAAGGNVAVVFAGAIPKKFMGRKTVAGDTSDLRFLDGKGVIVGLTAKGRAKHDKSGFVVHTAI